MSNADFDTRNTSPGTRPTTAKPAENGRKHRPSAARSAQPQEIAQRDTPNTTTRHHPRRPKTPVTTGDSLSVQPAPRVPSKELHPTPRQDSAAPPDRSKRGATAPLCTPDRQQLRGSCLTPEEPHPPLAGSPPLTRGASAFLDCIRCWYRPRGIVPRAATGSALPRRQSPAGDRPGRVQRRRSATRQRVGVSRRRPGQQAAGPTTSHDLCWLNQC